MKSQRNKLLGKINILAAQIGLSKDELYDYAEQWTGIASTHDAKGRHLLSALDATHLLRVVNNLENAQRGVVANIVRHDACGKPVPGIQRQQIRNIARLGYALKWSNADIRSFISRNTRGGKRDWNDLTLTEASGVIVGMEKVLRGRRQ